MRLWERGEPVDEAILRLTVGRDPQLDLGLVPYDCRASLAHAEMLAGIGVLEPEELAAIGRELERIAAEARAGEFSIAPEQEDGHTAIENRLTTALGAAGEKIHTGRSRNDQVLAALRLWGRDKVREQIAAVLAVIEELLDLAEEHAESSAPGYSHGRQAMATTVGHYFGAWAENLLDDLPWLELALAHLDRSPLGSASGFGVALPLDRRRVAERCGFAAVQENTLAVQNDRGKTEYLALGAAAVTATDLGRLAGDLVWQSSTELGWVGLPAALTTGSSIMPQKRNPDVLELVRAGAARLRARHAEVGAVYGPLGAGYHRDLQLTKEPFLDGMQALVDLAVATRVVLTALTIDGERARRLLAPGTGATDALYRRVAAGETFRGAYREVAREPALHNAGADSWRERRHLGAPGAEPSGAARRRLAAARARLGAGAGPPSRP